MEKVYNLSEEGAREEGDSCDDAYANVFVHKMMT